MNWRRACDRYGWIAQTTLSEATGEISALSIGIRHPHYGIMTASMHETPTWSLARLSAIAHRSVSECPIQDLPRVYVGARMFRDVVHDDECAVLGIIAFRNERDRVECAPLTLVRWNGLWLPFFEDENEWVLTGWDRRGKVSSIFKPFGWGCALLDQAEHASHAGYQAGHAGYQASHAGHVEVKSEHGSNAHASNLGLQNLDAHSSNQKVVTSERLGPAQA